MKLLFIIKIFTFGVFFTQIEPIVLNYSIFSWWCQYNLGIEVKNSYMI